MLLIYKIQHEDNEILEKQYNPVQSLELPLI